MPGPRGQWYESIATKCGPRGNFSAVSTKKVVVDTVRDLGRAKTNTALPKEANETPFLTDQLIEIFLHNIVLDALKVVLPAAESKQLVAYVKGKISPEIEVHKHFLGDRWN